jgi:hypothetical protein
MSSAIQSSPVVISAPASSELGQHRLEDIGAGPTRTCTRPRDSAAATRKVPVSMRSGITSW